MKLTRRLIALSGLLILSFLTIEAMPARGGKAILKQPDGTTFTAILKGDEYFRLLTTADGHAIIREEDGCYCYATYTADGQKTSTGYRVGSDVPAAILAASKNIPYQTLAAKAAEKRRITDKQEPLMRRLNRINTKSGGTPVVKHGIVILAQFQADPKDKYAQFTTPDLKQSFENLLMQKGYNGPDNNADGSAKDYFDSQFKGKYEFRFDVFGPVTLKHEKAYYGANNSYDSDKAAHEMVIEACKAVDAEADFSLYDDDMDGEVDNVYVFFAGGDEAQYAGDDCIWSHAWYIRDGAGVKLNLDGVRINRYACSSELATTRINNNDIATDFTFTGIGTFCHEFSHTLGLPDFYDTDYDKSGGESNALWRSTSLMDGGGYNNDGNTPPNYNAIERKMLGLAEAVDISRQDAKYTLQPIEQSSTVYKISGTTADEYYLIECRKTAGWDRYIYTDNDGNDFGPDSGSMLIYHVDKSKNTTGKSDSYNQVLTASQRWDYNEVNCNPDHECADLIEAMGTSARTISHIFFPQKTVTSYAPVFWDNSRAYCEINNIKGNKDGTVTFNVNTNGTTVETFQDKVLVSWQPGQKDYTGSSYIKIGSTTFEVQQTEDKNYCIIIGGLEYNKEYSALIYFDNEDEASATRITFKTIGYRTGISPFIVLKNEDRNDDGSFKSGAKVPLIICNALKLDEKNLKWLTSKPVECNNVTWYFNDKEITRENDGYYTLQGSGVLKAVINSEDGSSDTIVKEIIIK